MMLDVLAQGPIPAALRWLRPAAPLPPAALCRSSPDAASSARGWGQLANTLTQAQKEGTGVSNRAEAHIQYVRGDMQTW
jgi:hypothetical protein